VPLGWVFSCRIRKGPFGFIANVVVIVAVVSVNVKVKVIVIEFRFAAVKVAVEAVIMARFLFLLRRLIIPQLD